MRFSSTFLQITLLALIGCASQAHAAAPRTKELAIYAGKPYDSAHVTVVDSEGQAKLDGARAVVPKPAQSNMPGGQASAQVSAKDAAADALTLQWSKVWFAGLRIEGGAPLDLRPFLAHGVLSLDLNVQDLAQGGVGFEVRCGEHCERYVNYLIPGRAAVGKGWQHVVVSLSCFVHDGDDFSAVTQPFTLDATGSGTVSVANVRFEANGTPNTSCPDYRTQSVTPEMLNESWSIDWWLPRHQEKLAEIQRRKANHEKTDLIFVGDSITHNWEKVGLPVWNRYYSKYHALDLGFGGDRTENILWRLQHGEIDGIDPKVVVLMCGTNNTGARHEDPRRTAAGIHRVIEQLQRHLPKAKVLLLAVFPRDEKPDSELRKLNDGVNKIISGFADNKRVFFLDISKSLMSPDGIVSRDIMPDLLHPNEKGYEIWAKAMAPTLQRLMQQ
jgi:beta-glucosidase